MFNVTEEHGANTPTPTTTTTNTGTQDCSLIGQVGDGQSPAQTCTCEPGYANGPPAWDPVRGHWSNPCKAVECPIGSTGIRWPISRRFKGLGETSIHSAVSLLLDRVSNNQNYALFMYHLGTVPGDAGDEGTSGCSTDEGYSGSVTATSSNPFFTSTLTDQQATCSVSKIVFTFSTTYVLLVPNSAPQFHHVQGVNAMPGAGICVCEPGYENTPVWSSPSWTNLDCTSPKQCPGNAFE